MSDDDLGVSPETLKGKTYDLYGTDGNVFVIGVGGDIHAYEVVEDESDGYRSSMDKLREVPTEKAVVSSKPIATVSLYDSSGRPDGSTFGGSFGGWELRGDDGYVWLVFGTDDVDDYYPCFVFNFYPRTRGKEAR